MTENSLFAQSFANRYWQWPVKVKNLLSKLLKWDWPTTKHSPTHRQRYNDRNDQPQDTISLVERASTTELLSHRDSLHWYIPRIHGDTHCRKELFKKQLARHITALVLMHIYACISLSYHVLQSWEIVDPGGKCLPMCIQEHWDTSTQRLPSKTLPAEIHMLATLLLATLLQKEELDGLAEGLPGHVQPSTHSSLHTSCMLRLWHVVEQDFVHSLYCIPIGHFGTTDIKTQDR